MTERRCWLCNKDSGLTVTEECNYMCGNGWDNQTAAVVCRELGYTGGRAVQTQPKLKELSIDYSCMGTEKQLEMYSTVLIRIDGDQEECNVAGVACNTVYKLCFIYIII